MRFSQFAVILLLSLAVVGCGANPGARGKIFSTSATVNAETANNSSAANNFGNQTNGNLGANNVSKENVHKLLYAGANTKVLAQFLVWFGESNHMDVGYSSNDAAQVQRQITDMISRGIDGVIVDWYGPNNTIDEATKLVMHEAEKHAGFSFSIMIDAGAMGNSCSGCSSQDALNQLMQYVAKNYFPSPAYLNFKGQPVVTNFNVDRSNSIDWNAAKRSISAAPRFLFQDNDGFTHGGSDGSYSWVMPQMSNYGLDYLADFYDTGLGFANEQTMGAIYKGFNDGLAAWGSRRVMDQQCGQTWLQTIDKVNRIYSQGRQLPYLQLVTWNDYEEGTELESGIDSCLSLDASLSGNRLQWTVNGNENTVDHYSVFSSTDGKSLTELTQIKPGLHSLDLCSVAIPPGKHQLFVQAVGKPMLANRMPGPVSYTPACGG